MVSFGLFDVNVGGSFSSMDVRLFVMNNSFICFVVCHFKHPPAKVVKGQTQKGHRPPLSSNPKHSKNENSLKKQALGEPYAVHVRCTLLFTCTVACVTELRRDDNFLQYNTIKKNFFANL